MRRGLRHPAVHAVEPEIEGFEALIGEAGGPVRLFRFSCGGVLALLTFGLPTLMLVAS